MRSLGFASGIVAAAALAASPAMVAVPSFDYSGAPIRTFPKKGKQAKPKKRPNMRLVSKRVRRRHRRAGK